MYTFRKDMIENRNYYLSFPFPVLLLTGEKWMISDIPSSYLHFHNCCELGFCHSHSGELAFINDRAVPFQAGDIFFIPPNVPHTTYSTPGVQSAWSYLFFNPRMLFRDNLSSGSFVPEAQNDVRRYRIPSGASPRSSFLFQVLIEELSLKKPDYDMARSYLFCLYMEINRYTAQQAGKDPACEKTSSESDSREAGSASLSPSTLNIAPALDYIENNYMNKISIDELALLCHLSTVHFRRVFQNIMNTNPVDYITSVRIMNACNLLHSSNLSILSIAEQSGFRSLSNFNRHFSDTMCTTPTEFRKQMLQGAPDKRPSMVEYKGWL